MKTNGFKLRRESSGIDSIDKMIEGGCPKGSVVGLSGPPGVGKSIFSLHFVLAGARKGQKSVYINLEEPRSNINNMVKQLDFGNEFLDLEKKGLIVVKCFEYDEYDKIKEDLFNQISRDRNIKRLVVDSFNCFFTSVYDFDGASGIGVRKMVTDLFYKLRRPKLTSLLILEKSSRDGFYHNIPYLVDGIINLDFLDLGTIERRVFISKMRWTDQYKENMRYEISKKGIVVDEETWEN